MQSTDEKYMKEAIKQAKKAYAIGEVPIGCVIVYQDKIIGRGYNRRTIDNNTLAHAELAAIRKASRKMNDWRLEDCTMYVTLEPCQMCSGAIVQSRMTRVVVGCMNPKAGCAGSILNLLDMPEFNHQVVVVPGITFQREELEALGRFLSTLSNVEKLEVLPYHSMGKVKYDNLGIDYALKDTPQLTKAEAKSAESIILEAMRQARNV